MYVDFVIVLRLLADQFGENDHQTQCLVHKTDVFFAVSTNPDSCINPCYCAVVVFTLGSCFLRVFKSVL